MQQRQGWDVARRRELHPQRRDWGRNCERETQEDGSFESSRRYRPPPSRGDSSPSWRVQDRESSDFVYRPPLSRGDSSPSWRVQDRESSDFQYRPPPSRGDSSPSWRVQNRDFRTTNSRYRPLQSDSESSPLRRRQYQERRNGRPNRPNLRPLLVEMTENETPQNIAVSLSSCREELEERMRGRMDPEITGMLLKVFGKLADCVGPSGESLVDVLKQILECSFNEHIQDFVYDFPKEKNERKKQEACQHLMNSLKLMNMLLTVLPKTAERKVSATMLVLESVIKNSEYLGQEIQDYFNTIKDEFEQAKKKNDKGATKDWDGSHSKSPPNNFRDIPIIPELNDVVGNVPPFLRPNLVGGAYESVDHYLDVQYRLLREDFVRPLREVINERKSGDVAKMKENSLKVYENVRILYEKPGKDGIMHRIYFNAEKLHSVRWDSTKRLLKRNLVCLSGDEFKRNVLFAVIIETDPSDLASGFLTVQFIVDEEADIEQDLEDRQRLLARVIDKNGVYTMIESEGYFEAYRHVLTALKETQEIPLDRYIVHCYPDLCPPAYLRRREGESISYILPGSIEFGKYCGGRYRRHVVVDVLGETWPTPAELKLNDGQADALKLALRNDLAVIQGPPGTGKTHVGLAIMRILLENKRKWAHDKEWRQTDNDHCPILIVCYTNHALDQFLEGIQEFAIGQTLVRVGGRCQNEVTKKYTLAEIRAEKRRNGINPRAKFKHELERIESTLRSNSERLELSLRFILKIRALKQFLSRRLLWQFNINTKNRDEYSQFKYMESFEKWSPNNILLSWLRVHFVQEFDDFVVVRPKVTFWKSDTIKAKGKEMSWRQGLDDNQSESVASELAKTTSIMSESEERNVQNIHDLALKDRWRLYRRWVSLWQSIRPIAEPRCISEYDRLARMERDANAGEDFKIIKSADVIAATTTGVAKYRKLLYNLNCKIVVVEEAAEVLEAHIITAMPKSTEHLILIGDHQQLKPSPTVYELGRKYKMNTSLFERLINKVPHVTLTTQHRMRPEIADLVRPHIYKNLKDHSSVQNRDGITGIQKSVFFLSHSVLENNVADGKSKKNQHEVDFLVALCDYIITQGYKPEQITILTLYAGQVSAFGSKMQRSKLAESVKVTAVDNFQGEENDIILLSLVRSNVEEKIGFVGIENRICVALSRAKNTLYCIGNMKLFALKSLLWTNIVDHLQSHESIGEELMLQCKHHPFHLTPVKRADDFSKVPEGGCGTRQCLARLECGHACPRLCHPEDHTQYRCQKICGKPTHCEKNHVCKKRCCESCNPCVEKVEKTMPDCGHIEHMECHQSRYWRCQTKIDVTLPCEHVRSEKCFQARQRRYMYCFDKCRELLDCGHHCQGSCHECFQGRLHMPCASDCGRTLVCGHVCKSTCSFCPPCQSKCETRCKHSTCTKQCGRPCTLCKENCPWQCPHFKCGRLCSEPCDRPRCNQPCQKILPCDHPCIGLCGEPCPNLCRVCHSDRVKEIFFGDEDEIDARFVQLEDCSHIFTYKSLDRWMDQEEEGSAIKMKECPQCKSTIWRSTRYGSIVNQLLRSLNKVKQKIWGDAEDALKYRSRLREDILRERQLCYMKKYTAHISDIMRELGPEEAAVERFYSPSQDPPSCQKIRLLEQRFRKLQKLGKLDLAREEVKDKLGENSDEMADKESDELETTEFEDRTRSWNPERQNQVDHRAEQWTDMKEIDLDLSTVADWVRRKRVQFTAYEEQGFSRETRRIEDALRFIPVETEYKKRLLRCDDAKEEHVNRLKLVEPTIKQLRMQLLKTLMPYDDSRKETVESLFNDISEKDPGLTFTLNISENERKMICDAMGFAKKGHWYSCPNGHVYCITECGGATEKTECPECGSEIGGERHMLLETNRVATEMDDGTRPAFDVEDNRLPENLLDDLRRQGFG